MLSLVQTATVNAQMRITEYMYKGTGGEFVELTNIGLSAINLSGWSYDDDSRIPGIFSLTGFGLVQSGESVVFTESSASTFRSDWALPATVKILGGVTNNIGSSDEINIYDASNTLVDRLTYSSSILSTNGVSGNPGSAAVIGANAISDWVYSAPGDVFGSYASMSGNGDVGNPGSFAAVPEPANMILFVGPLMLLIISARFFRSRLA